MVYHVIIALNSVGKRRVGIIISLLENKGLELVEIRKRSSNAFCKEYTDVDQLVLQSKLNELEAMSFYQEKFHPEVLSKKMKHFYQNHVELFFEGEVVINPNNIWELICKEFFLDGREIPIMFVTTSSGENGINISLIPDEFESRDPLYMDPKKLVPLGTSN